MSRKTEPPRVPLSEEAYQKISDLAERRGVPKALILEEMVVEACIEDAYTQGYLKGRKDAEDENDPT